eukprot:5491997-Pyramimonas_sp.AAC.1
MEEGAARAEEVGDGVRRGMGGDIECEREELIKILVGAPDDQLMQRRYRRHLHSSDIVIRFTPHPPPAHPPPPLGGGGKVYHGLSGIAWGSLGLSVATWASFKCSFGLSGTP